MPMVTYQFHLPHEHHGALQKLAHERGMAVAEIVRRAVARVLDEELSKAGDIRIAPPAIRGPRYE
jgi:hypothetical protein